MSEVIAAICCNTRVAHKANEEWITTKDAISDDSSFHGNEDTKAEFERRAASYNPSIYWNIVQWNIQCRAARSVPKPVSGTKEMHITSTSSAGILTATQSSFQSRSPPESDKATTSSKPYNPYAGDPSAKQLHEPLSSFLSRLRPSKTSIATAGPWIWVANPYSSYRPTRQDVAGFKQEGSKALAEYLLRKDKFEQNHLDKTAGSITRMLSSDRALLEERIVLFAGQFGVMTGKWMLFQSPEEVDSTWSKIADAVINNELGSAAKVATDDGDPNNRIRLICVYTYDFSDVADVKRVLEKMRQLGLFRDSHDKIRPIYYKCDAYTHLDIVGGNEYKLRASMYNSKDFPPQITT